jgi:hypothetical protein
MADCKDPTKTYISGSTVDCDDPTVKCLNWSVDPNCEEKWDTTIFTWSDCILIDEVIPPDEDTGGGIAWQPPTWVEKECDKLDDKDKKKKKRLIKLICWVRDKKIVEEKDVIDMKIDMDDVRMVKKEIDKKLNVTWGD